MKNRFLAVLLLFVAFPFSSVAEDAIPKLRLVTENYPPYNMSDSDDPYEHKAGNIVGISSDIVKALLRRTGHDYSLKLRNWDFAYNFAQRKAYRGVFSTTFTEARAPLFKWVGPLAANEWTFFAASDSELQIDSLEDVKPLKVGSYQGDVMSVWLNKHGYNSSELDDDTLNPKRLADGHIDLWLTDTNSGLYWAKKQGVAIKPVYSFQRTELYLAMHKETPDSLIDELNAALKVLKTDGTVARINLRYR